MRLTASTGDWTMSLGNPQFVESIIISLNPAKEYRIGPRCRISAATEHAPVYSPASAKKILVNGNPDIPMFPIAT